MTLEEFELKIDKISHSFSLDEIELRDWLLSQGIDCLYSLENILTGRYLNDVITDFYFRNKLNFEENKRILYMATLVLHELRQYGGNSLNIFIRKPNYSQILFKVHQRLGKQFKQVIQNSATVIQREEAIAMMVLQDVIRNLSEQEIHEIVNGLELDSTQENRSKIIFETLSGAGFLALSKFLGGKFIRDLAFKMLEKYLLKKMGTKLGQQMTKKMVKEGSEKILLVAEKKLPVYIFRRSARALGWVFIAKDIFDLSGEASRITTPMIIQISLHRTLNRQFSESM